MFSLPRIATALIGSVLLVVVLAVAPLGSAQTIPVQPQIGTGLSVVGQGIVLAQPNVARITLGSEVFDQSLSNAMAEAARRMDAVVSKLKASGIPDTDIRTTAFNINPQYDQRDQNQPLLRGYQVQNLVEVRTTSVSGLGALLDDAVSSGATRVFGISFESSDMGALKTQARDQAMTDARAKADQLARDAGVALGRPMSIDESDSGGVTPVRFTNAPQPAAAQATTPIQPGELRVSTTVHVVWSIQ
ncbi:MAG: SIMPL domain-containing protein [Chloroflexi bacterium]|nr:SIMPL domain-containing protein [Chloroflexota bacterium]